MRIDNIEIKNFKGFKNEYFQLNPRFTVFIGDNAKGKTSVLDAISVALGGYLKGIDVADKYKRGIDVNEVRVLTLHGQPRPQLPCEITTRGEVNGVAVTSGWRVMVENIRTTYRDTYKITSIVKRMLKDSRETGSVTFPVIAYHGTGRLWAEHKNKVDYKKQTEGVAMAYIDCLSAKSSSKEFLSWYMTYEDEVRKFEQEQDKTEIETFKECIMSMIPDRQWEDMAFSFKDKDLVGTFTTPNGTKEKLMFSQLSDGYRNVIGMVADIAYRCIKLNPHLGKDAIKETPGVVLIDELDMHLHPNWQRRIVKDLKEAFPKVQFVCTTHSPFIVQSLDSDELVNLDKLTDVDPEDIKIDDVATNIMGVKSAYSEANQEVHQKAKSLIEQIDDPNADKEVLKEAIENISDPGLRALLELKMLSQSK